MARDTGDLLREALSLPPEARAALADSLLESLDTDIDEGAEQEWREEIRRRIADLDSGRVQTIPWSEVHARLNRQIGR
jgi:putative addiction module component (TIGR02574 family)